MNKLIFFLLFPSLLMAQRHELDEEYASELSSKYGISATSILKVSEESNNSESRDRKRDGGMEGFYFFSKGHTSATCADIVETNNSSMNCDLSSVTCGVLEKSFKNSNPMLGMVLKGIISEKKITIEKESEEIRAFILYSKRFTNYVDYEKVISQMKEFKRKCGLQLYVIAVE